jgi:hypothetical protein
VHLFLHPLIGLLQSLVTLLLKLSLMPTGHLLMWVILRHFYDYEKLPHNSEIELGTYIIKLNINILLILVVLISYSVDGHQNSPYL